MDGKNSTRGHKWGWLALVSALMSQSVLAEPDLIKFNERLINLLPDGVVQESLIASRDKGTLAAQEGYMDFGLKVCKAISSGTDQKTIMTRELIPYIGEGVGKAVYQAALDTLCPGAKK